MSALTIELSSERKYPITVLVYVACKLQYLLSRDICWHDLTHDRPRLLPCIPAVTGHCRPVAP